ncbi:hypothetical protein AMECASPLE_025893 [Ameca splendens]|uniref:Uncharacterized protein n=1 Tax=Ameca splendens TaxID=208324 RepID=A0ABV0ZQT1_9TELE
MYFCLSPHLCEWVAWGAGRGARERGQTSTPTHTHEHTHVTSSAFLLLASFFSFLPKQQDKNSIFFLPEKEKHKLERLYRSNIKQTVFRLSFQACLTVSQT